MNTVVGDSSKRFARNILDTLEHASGVSFFVFSRRCFEETRKDEKKMSTNNDVSSNINSKNATLGHERSERAAAPSASFALLGSHKIHAT